MTHKKTDRSIATFQNQKHMSSNNESPSPLVGLSAIVEFVETLRRTQSLQAYRNVHMYSLLLKKTSVVHTQSIARHIEAFRRFLSTHPAAVESRNASLLTAGSSSRIEYSDRIFICMRHIWATCNREEGETIWRSLVQVQAAIYKGSSGGVFSKSSSAASPPDATGTDNEEKFLQGMMDRIQETVPAHSTNPTEVITNLMSTGMLTKLVSDMDEGVRTRKVDMNKLLTTAIGMLNTPPPAGSSTSVSESTTLPNNGQTTHGHGLDLANLGPMDPSAILSMLSSLPPRPA